MTDTEKLLDALGAPPGPLLGRLRWVYLEWHRKDTEIMMAHRRGFTEACDRMGLPSTGLAPMERIARAGGRVSGEG